MPEPLPFCRVSRHLVSAACQMSSRWRRARFATAYALPAAPRTEQCQRAGLDPAIPPSCLGAQMSMHASPLRAAVNRGHHQGPFPGSHGPAMSAVPEFVTARAGRRKLAQPSDPARCFSWSTRSGIECLPSARPMCRRSPTCVRASALVAATAGGQPPGPARPRYATGCRCAPFDRERPVVRALPPCLRVASSVAAGSVACRHTVNLHAAAAQPCPELSAGANFRLIGSTSVLSQTMDSMTRTQDAQLAVLHVRVLLACSRDAANVALMLRRRSLMGDVALLATRCGASMTSEITPLVVDLLWDLAEALPQPAQLVRACAPARPAAAHRRSLSLRGLECPRRASPSHLTRL